MARPRFQEGIAGRAPALALRAWTRLPDLLRQSDAGWWQDLGVAQRLLDDLGALSGADALIIGVAEDAVTAAAEEGGDDALDALGSSSMVQTGAELAARLVDASPYALMVAVPGVAELTRRFGASDPEIAEDALSDLARAYFEAGADALLVVAADEAEARESTARVLSMSDYYRRPTIGAVTGGSAEFTAWVEGSPEVEIARLDLDEGRPELSAGLVLCLEDVSTSWNAARLHQLAGERPSDSAS